MAGQSKAAAARRKAPTEILAKDYFEALQRYFKLANNRDLAWLLRHSDKGNGWSTAAKVNRLHTYVHTYMRAYMAVRIWFRRRHIRTYTHIHAYFSNGNRTEMCVIRFGFTVEFMFVRYAIHVSRKITV